MPFQGHNTDVLCGDGLLEELLVDAAAVVIAREYPVPAAVLHGDPGELVVAIFDLECLDPDVGATQAHGFQTNNLAVIAQGHLGLI